MAGGGAMVSLLVVASVVLGLIAPASAAYGGDIQFALNLGVELSPLEQQLALADGLAWGFYARSCPRAGDIVAETVGVALRKDAGTAAGLLRVAFHDCFVQGCDGSLLLKGSDSELNQPPNRSIRQAALDMIDDAKAKIEQACPGVVSCADIVILAGMEAVKQVGGPAFNVPLGRRDSSTPSNNVNDLPPPTASLKSLVDTWASKNLDIADLVSLSGAHTLGVAHCGAFTNRLRPTVDSKLNKDYAKYLTMVCPTDNSGNTTGLDFFTPNKFDNQYFKNFFFGAALMDSDQNLDGSSQAMDLVKLYSQDQSTFFNQFLWSYIKMSQAQPLLTGSKGVIRKVCSNPAKAKKVELEPVVLSMVTDADQ